MKTTEALLAWWCYWPIFHFFVYSKIHPMQSWRATDEVRGMNLRDRRKRRLWGEITIGERLTHLSLHLSMKSNRVYEFTNIFFLFVRRVFSKFSMTFLQKGKETILGRIHKLLFHWNIFHILNTKYMENSRLTVTSLVYT